MFLSRLYLLIRHWSGPDHLFVEPLEAASHHRLTAYSTDHFGITIICIERHYSLVSLYNPLHRKPVVVYELSAQASDEAPAVLKQACELTLSLPRPYPSWVLKEYHIERTIQQFLDLLMRHIELSRNTQSPPSHPRAA